MKRVIIYASKFGSTEECAYRLKEVIGDIDLINLTDKNKIDISGYDEIILGSAIYAGSFNKNVKQFISKNESELLKKNLSMFIMAADETKDYFKDNLSDDLYSHMLRREHFGAALDTDKLNFIAQLFFKYILKKGSFKKLLDDNIISFAEQIKN